ncbi:MAG: sigma 54-interacting transcriptional regulator [Desulfatirhabdiaceae bacterium]
MSSILDQFAGWRIRNKLIVTILPPVIFILLLTGFVSNWFSSQFLSLALERSSRLICMAQAHEIEQFIERSRLDLISLTQSSISVDEARKFLENHKRFGKNYYREMAYIGTDNPNRFFLLNLGPSIFEIRSDAISDVKPNPLIMFEHIRTLKPDQVYLSDIFTTFYPLPMDQNGHVLSTVVFRMAAPIITADGKTQGFIILGLDGYHLRNILSLYNSNQSPLHAFPRTSEIRYSYIFDRRGWILFQSETPDDKFAELSTERIRQGMSGTLGKPGFENAFRPGSEYETFWKIVAGVQSGQVGSISVNEKGNQTQFLSDNSCLAYAPVRFGTLPSADREIVFGIAYMDRSRLKLAAQMRQYDILLIITICSAMIITIAIILIGRRITRPIFNLAQSVSQLDMAKPLKEISVPELDMETTMLKNAINRMILAMKNQLTEIRLKDRHIQVAEQREKVRLEDELPDMPSHSSAVLTELVGFGNSLESLKSEILKASGVDADVLIIGETGTGKQLTAEAIHYNSKRRESSFITINCGALDENLLLDALYGHIKGAFSDAKTDRNGAFLAANHGTLFLDEIGNASPRVQQALLRTLSIQKIKPLGSDQEIDIDVRLISATNEDLKSLIDRGIFREDLYFRLKVISITTPPLRDHKEDIPALVDCFIRDASEKMQKKDIGLSKGALERLKNYNWPGNVRELKNCITRAVAMVESDVIQTEDIRLEEIKTDGIDEAKAVTPALESKTPPKRRPQKKQPPTQVKKGLNDRQLKALPVIARNGEITRQEYQQLVGHELTDRTSLYDLQTMVRMGFLKRTGNGKNTRYVSTELLYQSGIDSKGV